MSAKKKKTTKPEVSPSERFEDAVIEEMLDALCCGEKAADMAELRGAPPMALKLIDRIWDLCGANILHDADERGFEPFRRQGDGWVSLKTRKPLAKQTTTGSLLYIKRKPRRSAA